MSFAKFLKRTTALLGTLAMLSNTTMAFAQDAWLPTGGPIDDGFRDQPWWHHGDDDNYRNLSLQEKIQLLRQKVKYVFVIFHENKVVRPLFWHLPRRQRPVQRTSRRYACHPDTQLFAEIPRYLA